MTRLLLLCIQKLVSCKYIWVSGDWSVRPSLPASAPILYRFKSPPGWNSASLLQVHRVFVLFVSGAEALNYWWMREKSLHLWRNHLLTSSHNSGFLLEIYENTLIRRVEIHPEYGCIAIGFGPINDQVECFYRPCIMLSAWRTSRRRQTNLISSFQCKEILLRVFPRCLTSPSRKISPETHLSHFFKVGMWMSRWIELFLPAQPPLLNTYITVDASARSTCHLSITMRTFSF